MRKIDDYFSKTIDKSLYHYTGISALTGISNSKCVWASHAYYMNDSEEITHACKILEDVLRPRFAFSKNNDVEIIFLTHLQEWTKKFVDKPHNIFVFSLSEQQSLLSQWRSYTPHGKGVSIEFTEKTLNNMMKNGVLRLAKCLYDTTDQVEVIRALIDKLINTFKSEQPNITPTTITKDLCFPFLDQFQNDILQVLSIIKNGAFEEEQEWRLISNYYPNEFDSAIKLREGASMLIPYIEMPLGDSQPYFDTVMLGPSPHKELSLTTLHMFLKSKNVCRWTNTCEIPYREW